MTPSLPPADRPGPGALLLGFVLLFWFCRMAPLAGWDDGFYTSQLVSLAGQHDLLLHDDLLRLDTPPDLKLTSLLLVREDGALRNDFSIGPALANGAYAWPFARAAGAGRGLRGLRVALALGAVMALIFLVLVLALLVRDGGVRSGRSLLTAVVAIAGGPLALYATREYLGSHLWSALWYAAFLVAVLRWLRGHRLLDASLVGLAAGLLAVTRWQDAILPALFLPAIVTDAYRRARDSGRGSPFQGLALMAAWCLLAVAPQLLAWKRQFGRFLLIPQGDGFLAWTQPALTNVLFSPFHGLVPWAPGFAVGLLAALLLWRPDVPNPRLFKLGVVGAVVASIYISAAAHDWWGGASYGARRLSSLTPLVALGWGQILKRRRPVWLVAVIAPVLAWTWFTATAHYSGFDDLDLLFTHTAHASNPLPADHYGSARWIDRAGSLPILLRPGFTLTDRPRTADRLVGAVVIAACLASALLGWRLLRRPSVQRFALVLSAAWLALAIGWISTSPDNERANGAWLRVVTCRTASTDLAAVPASLQPAAYAVIQAQSRMDPPRPGPDAAATWTAPAGTPMPFPLDAALSSQNRRLLSELCPRGPERP